MSAILIGYPLAYWIATQGGRWKNFLIGLVVVPFFTSYLIRTIAWTHDPERRWHPLIHPCDLPGA